MLIILAAAVALVTAPAPHIDPRASLPLPMSGGACLTGMDERGEPIPDPRCMIPTPWLGQAQRPPNHAPGSCHVRHAANGMQLPDPACTPGAINPTLTVEVLRSGSFRTATVRDKLTSAAQKRRVYGWYGLVPPKHNTGADQMCELDHVIDLSAGGADSLENIFPQCQAPGAPPVPVGEREFKIKDRFAEHVLIAAIKAGADATALADMQRRIAADWTQFLPKSPPAAQPDTIPAESSQPAR